MSVKLTQTYAEKATLTDGSAEVTFWDSEVKGFGLRVRQGGSRTWVAMYRVKGRLRKATLGEFPTVPAPVARQMAKEWKASLTLTGEDPAAAREEKRRIEPTWGEIVARYKTEKIPTFKNRAWQGIVKGYLDNHIPKAWNSLAMSKLTRRHVHEVRTKIGVEDGKKTTANRVCDVIQGVWNWAIEIEAIPANTGNGNPAEGLRKAGHRFEEKPRHRFINAKELEAFTVALQKEPDQIVRAAFVLFPLLGLRKTAMFQLKWANVDFEARHIVVERVKKKARVDYLPLTPQIESILKIVPRTAGSPWVFPGSDPKNPRADMRRQWDRIRQEMAEHIAKESGVDIEKEDVQKLDVNVHDLRRTLGKWMGDAGVAIQVISAVMHHSSAKVTERHYSWVTTNQLAQPMSEHQGRILQIVKPAIAEAFASEGAEG